MKNNSVIKKLYLVLLAAVLLFTPRLVGVAQENYTSNYSQHEYTEDEGFDSRNANCICQSMSGYIWIGTDNGLYRYDGSNFVLYTMDSANEASIYRINCIVCTSDGKLYVGTENYGLFIYDNGSFSRVVDAYNLGISTINQMYEDAEGNLWLATSQGIYCLSNDGIRLIEDEKLQNVNIGCIGGFENKIYAVANGDTLITVTDKTNVSVRKRDKFGIDDINTMYVDSEGTRYYGSVGRSILKMAEGKKYELISTGGISGINKIYEAEDRIWVLSDDGAAYFTKDSKNLTIVSGLLFNESMNDMIVDYEGNYWFTSYRKGLLFLSRSKFVNLTMKYGINETIVNCVVEFGGQLYIGTDDGLCIVDSDGNVITDNELVGLLRGISIRDLYVDSGNNLWICTYRIYGVIKVKSYGTYSFYNRSESNLVSNYVNCVVELSSGNMAVGTENGISIIKDGKVIRNYTKQDGFENADIISLYYSEDGLLYAGSNGAGIYTIDMESNIKKVVPEDGVKFNVISVIRGADNGLWIGTDNGLYYQEGTIRQITAVDPTNRIYDILTDKSGYMWILGSKGLYRYYANDLLSNTAPEYDYYTKNDGIISNITESSSSYITKNGMIYICCDEGLCSFNKEEEYINNAEPKVRISSIAVDGKEYKFSDIDGRINVPKNTNRITVKFSVLSYVNRPDIAVKYYLDGFENEPRTISGSDVMEVEYTNLEGGIYEFVLYAENSDGIESEHELTFVIDKQLGFWETNLSKILVLVFVFIFLVALIISIRGISRVLRRKTEQVEELSKKSEKAEKSNQAKNDYVNYLSHEIRVPLNTILGVSEMVLRNTENVNDEQMAQYRALNDAGYEILGMVDGISRLSNLKDGSIELIEKGYAVSDIIDELSTQFKSMVNRDLVDLKVSIEDNIPNGLIGDAARIKELITNIFARAVSTTKEGYISINVDWNKTKEDEEEADDSEISLNFRISDTGVGVKEERIEQLFELDDSYGKSDIGKFDISLGLAISKQLITMMGGNITAASTYGAGTTIEFNIRQAVFDYSYVNYNINRKREIERRDSNSRLWLPDVRILIVDESELGLQVEKTLFDTYGVVVDTVTSGFDAIDKVMVSSYDVVFMDTVMAVMDGKDTVREIRNLDGEEYKKLPVIAMSVNTVDMSREDILESGFDEVLVKPLELDEVENILRMYISEEKINEKTTDIDTNEDVSVFVEASKVLSKYIDVENALKMTGGSFDIFNQFIINYKKQYEEDVYMLQDYIDDDVRSFRNIIHSIKISSSNIGAFAASRKAANLLSAINIGNMQYAKENTREFMALMKDMFKVIDVYISKITKEKESVTKEYKDAINRGKLKELRAYLKACELEPVKALIADIDSFEYGDIDTEFFNALKMTIDSMDYEGASEIIDQYLNSI